MSPTFHPPGTSRRRPRRASVAVGLFLLLFVAPVTLAGVGQEELGDVPATFRTAAPYDGDEGFYRVSYFNKTGSGYASVPEHEEWLRFVHRYHWMPFEGEWVSLHEVGEYRGWLAGQRPWGCVLNSGWVEGFQSDVFTPDGRRVGNGKGCDHSEAPVVTEDPAWETRVLTQRMERAEFHQNHLYQQMDAAFCGHRHAFQENKVALDRLEGLFDDCWIHSDTRLPSPVYTALGMAPYGDEEALIVHGEVGGNRYPVTNLEWWFLPSLPYPVRVTVEPAETDILIVTDLDRLKRGTPPRTTDLSEELDIERRPWGFIGPDDEGIDHPFPLSEALQAAKYDPTFLEFKTFMLEHPDAVVRSAGHSSGVEARSTTNTTWHKWTLTLSDGQQEQTFVIQKNSPQVNEQYGPVTGIQGIQMPSLYSYDSSDKEPSQRPAALELPDVPTVASIFALYENVTGKQPNSWAIRDWCSVCRVSETRTIHVGQTHEGTVRHSNGVERNGTSHFLELDTRGTILGWKRLDQNDHNGPEAAPDPPAHEPFDHELGAMATESILIWRLHPGVAAGSFLMALMVAITYWFWPFVKASPTALFTRLKKDRLLDHPIRQAIHDAIAADPGIHYRELTRKVDRPDGTVRHHLVKLLQGDLVSSVRCPGYTCYFLPGQQERAKMTGLASLKSPVARALLDAVIQYPEITGTEAARSIGVTPATVQHHVGRLERAGLLARERVGRVVRLKPTAAGAQVRSASQS